VLLTGSRAGLAAALRSRCFPGLGAAARCTGGAAALGVPRAGGDDRGTEAGGLWTGAAGAAGAGAASGCGEPTAGGALGAGSGAGLPAASAVPGAAISMATMRTGQTPRTRM
jgi:hypothetical protein